MFAGGRSNATRCTPAGGGSQRAPFDRRPHRRTDGITPATETRLPPLTPTFQPTRNQGTLADTAGVILHMSKSSKRAQAETPPTDNCKRERIRELGGGSDAIFEKGSRRKYTVAEIIAALEESAGVKSVAARRLGCSRSTLAQYAAEHPEIDKAVLAIREDFKDHVEGRLFKAIAADNLSAILFFLKTQAKDRGYSERTEVTTPPRQPIEVQTTFDWSRLEQQELRLIAALAMRARGKKDVNDDMLVAQGLLPPWPSSKPDRSVTQ